MADDGHLVITEGERSEVNVLQFAISHQDETRHVVCQDALSIILSLFVYELWQLPGPEKPGEDDHATEREETMTRSVAAFYPA
jgi:hypothetical protein